MYLRGEDRRGCGRITFHFKDVAQVMGLSVVTIKRYLRQCVQAGFIRQDYQKRGDRVTVDYVALNKVCMQLGLDDYGAIAEIPYEYLRASKEIATQLIVEARQCASRFEARRAKKSKKSLASLKEVLTPFRTLKGSSSSQKDAKAARGRRADIIYIGPRKTLVTKEFVLFGTSQQNTAESMGRHRSTVNRRLSNARRLKKGVPYLLRKQLAVKSHYQECWSNRLDDSVENRPFMRFGMKYFTLHCNVYEEYFFLIPAKVSRLYFRKQLKEIENSKKVEAAIAFSLSESDLGSDSTEFCGEDAIVSSENIIPAPF